LIDSSLSFSAALPIFLLFSTLFSEARLPLFLNINTAISTKTPPNKKLIKSKLETGGTK